MVVEPGTKYGICQDRRGVERALTKRPTNSLPLLVRDNRPTGKTLSYHELEPPFKTMKR